MTNDVTLNPFEEMEQDKETAGVFLNETLLPAMSIVSDAFVHPALAPIRDFDIVEVLYDGYSPDTKCDFRRWTLGHAIYDEQKKPEEKNQEGYKKSRYLSYLGEYIVPKWIDTHARAEGMNNHSSRVEAILSPARPYIDVEGLISYRAYIDKTISEMKANINSNKARGKRDLEESKERINKLMEHFGFTSAEELYKFLTTPSQTSTP